jgi:NADP-dependent 3-hydroxy acid dehydrogenase YdfG
MAPDLTQMAVGGVRTLRAFGKRIPGAGGILAESLNGAVRGKVVLITGASSGIGEAAAVKIGAAGGTVLLVARTEEKLNETKRKIEAQGGTAFVHPADLSDREAIDRMAEEVLRTHGHVDVLVNNAGRSIRRSVGRSYDRFHDYERTMQLNYFGPVKLILDLLPAMRERKSGHLIYIASISGLVPDISGAAYQASKRGMLGLSHAIRVEEKENGIRTCVICPGLVDTEILDKRPVKPAPETLAKALQSEDIAQAALFVAKLPARAAVPEMQILPTVL